jgi:quercetin dioxygenase-like cupin family protein
MFVLKAGDVLVIPPDMPHRVVALEESTATDLFTPARADWIRGDDAYLRE